MNQKLFLVLLILSSVIACKKEPDLIMPKPSAPHSTPVPVDTYADYAKLKEGNYWIYQRYSIDSSGNATPTNQFDSCYVVKDTLFNNKVYHIVHRPSYNGTPSDFMWADSLNYIIDARGKIVFASDDFTTLLEQSVYTTGSDTICTMQRKMADKDVAVTVAAGTFITRNAKETYFMHEPFTTAGNVRYRNTRYSQNIGIITETLPFFVSSLTTQERRLIRYHVE